MIGDTEETVLREFLHNIEISDKTLSRFMNGHSGQNEMSEITAFVGLGLDTHCYDSIMVRMGETPINKLDQESTFSLNSHRALTRDAKMRRCQYNQPQSYTVGL